MAKVGVGVEVEEDDGSGWKRGLSNDVNSNGGTAILPCFPSAKKMCHLGEWSRGKYGAKANGGWMVLLSLLLSSSGEDDEEEDGCTAFLFFDLFRPNKASMSPSSGSTSSRSSSFTAGTLVLPGGIIRALMTN